MGEIILNATHAGILTIGNNEVPCAVLSNKTRVIVQREFVGLLTGNKKGGLDRYTKAQNLQEFMPAKYVDQPHEKAVIKFSAGGQIAYGYEARDIVSICEGYLKARDAKKLRPDQEHLATQAEIIIRSCAVIGIEALIDETTGYQAIRDADDLQMRLRAYIAEGLQAWTKMFPTELFNEFYRLDGMAVPYKRKAYPLRFGKYIMRYVYDTMDKDVADWLSVNNPGPTWGKLHHQWLTEEFGRPKLFQHLHIILGIARASATKESFKENICRAFPKYRKRKVKRVPEVPEQPKLFI
jgi:hypothetical protein